MSLLTLALVIVIGLLPAIFAVHGHNTFYDDSKYYLSCARSMAIGEGYTVSGELHRRYPFITSVLYIPVYKIFGFDYVALQSVAVFWLALAGIAIHWFWRQQKAPHSNLLTFLFLTSYIPVYLTDTARSDLPYLVVCFTALSLTEKWFVKRETPPLGAYFVMPMLASVGVFLRLSAVSLTATIVALPLLSSIMVKHRGERSLGSRGYVSLGLKRSIILGVMTGALVFAGYIGWLGLHLPNYASDMEDATLVWEARAQVIPLLSAMMSQITTSSFFWASVLSAAPALFAFVILGGIRTWQKGVRAAHVYVIFHFLLYAWLAIMQETRQMLPVMPILLWWAGVGVLAVWRGEVKNARWMMLLGILFGLLSLFATSGYQRPLPRPLISPVGLAGLMSFLTGLSASALLLSSLIGLFGQTLFRKIAMASAIALLLMIVMNNATYLSWKISIARSGRFEELYASGKRKDMWEIDHYLLDNVPKEVRLFASDPAYYIVLLDRDCASVPPEPALVKAKIAGKSDNWYVEAWPDFREPPLRLDDVETEGLEVVFKNRHGYILRGRSSG
jgi:hypothetical protein